MPDVGGDPQQQQESSDPFAGVDWDAVKKQLIEMGPPPQPPMYTGETDHPMFKYPAMDPVFDPEMDLAAPTEEDQRWADSVVAWRIDPRKLTVLPSTIYLICFPFP